MKLNFNCAACGKSYLVDTRWAGKRATCRTCGSALRVPLPAIPLGPADGPIPGAAPDTEMTARDLEFAPHPAAAPAAILEPLPPDPRRATAMPVSRRRRHTSGWFPHTLSFILGAVTAIAISHLYEAMNPPPAPAVPGPAVQLQIRFEGSQPPDVAETRRRAIASISTAVDAAGMRVSSNAPVRLIATIHKVREGIISLKTNDPTTQPASIREDELDTEIELRNSAGTVFWHDVKEGSLNQKPESVRVPEGKSIEQAVQMEQWREAADRFSKMSYPNASAVLDAQVGLPRSNE